MYEERSKKKTFCLHCTIIVPQSLLHSLSTIITHFISLLDTISTAKLKRIPNISYCKVTYLENVPSLPPYHCLPLTFLENLQTLQLLSGAPISIAKLKGILRTTFCTVLYCVCRCGCWPACCWCSSPWWSTPSSSAGSSSISATSRSGGRTRSRRRSRRPPLRCEIGRELFTTQ